MSNVVYLADRKHATRVVGDASSPLPVVFDGSLDAALSGPLPAGSNTIGRTLSPAATTTFGTRALTTTTAAALGSQACVAVNVENPGTNVVDVLIGDAGTQPYRLTPGESLDVACTDVSQVYARNATSTTQTINWAARVEA